jgi:hypothetical protein
MYSPRFKKLNSLQRAAMARNRSVWFHATILGKLVIIKTTLFHVENQQINARIEYHRPKNTRFDD